MYIFLTNFSVQMHVDNAVDVPGLLGHMHVSLQVRLVAGMSCAAVVNLVRQAVQSGRLNSILADLGAAGLAVSLLNMSGCLNVYVFSYYCVCVSDVPQPSRKTIIYVSSHIMDIFTYIYIYICRYSKFKICQEIRSSGICVVSYYICVVSYYIIYIYTLCVVSYYIIYIYTYIHIHIVPAPPHRLPRVIPLES